jgi:hypothetical protein
MRRTVMAWSAGDARVVRRFLLFPQTLLVDGTKEYQQRWLEWAWIWQEYIGHTDLDFLGFWQNRTWAAEVSEVRR